MSIHHSPNMAKKSKHVVEDGRVAKRQNSIAHVDTTNVPAVVSVNVVTTTSYPTRDQLIANLAYRHAEARGFTSGHDVDDWLSAEAEVHARLDGEGRAY